MRLWKRENEKSKKPRTIGAVTHTHTHTHKYNLKDIENGDIIKLGGTIMDENKNIRRKQEYVKQKYSKKYAKKIKRKLQVSMFSIAMVLLLIAGGKLAGLSVPINNIKDIAKKGLIADENQMQEEKVKSSKVTIAEDGAIECESIVQGVRDCELGNGTYTFRVKGNINGTEETKNYKVELINYYDDVTYSLTSGQTSRTISLGDSTTEYKMLVVKYHKNLTIDSGVYVTATAVSSLTYKKGMYLCVMGELKNSGTISMTARGTYNQAGENVYLWKNIDNSYEYVPAVGGAGGASAALSGYTGNVSQRNPGNSGFSGTSRRTGGGGSGGVYGGWKTGPGIRSGSGGNGTSYSGGAGSGGVMSELQNQSYQLNGNAAGGEGTPGIWYGDGGWNRIIYGGTGTVNGFDIWGKFKGLRTGTSYYMNRDYGTGGLLTLYANELLNTGVISSNGSDNICPVYGNSSTGGGASGGGSVNIFANTIKKQGYITANGGTTNATVPGGYGGAGSWAVTKTMPNFNYPTKEIKLNVNESYNIDKSKLSYLDVKNEHKDFVSMGEIKYEILDEEIANINSDGKITGKKEGKTKVKIIDTTNNLSTYIYVEIINNVKIDVQEGVNFTIALKQNGTVWSYGTNTNGQLGNDTAIGEQCTVPTQVKTGEGTYLENITQISTGYSHVLALTKQGEVYAWGANTNGQLGIDDVGAPYGNPQKIDGISNIVKIDAYKNKSIALSSDGKVYVWGEGYTSLPMRKVLTEKIVDISGDLLLTEKGKVYNISNTQNEIEGLTRIAKISSGEAHNLALTVDGGLYSWGTNTYGECGSTVGGVLGITEVANEIYEISAGNGTSILQGEDGSIYVLGNNANGQIGLGSTTYVTGLAKITLEEDVEIEDISAGEGTHSGLVDKNGFVWHTGLNTKGELGIENTISKNIFTKTGTAILAPNCKDQIYLDLEEEQIIENKLENSFNLKIDLIDDNPENFKIEIASNIVILSGTTIKAKEFGNTSMTITHIPTGKTREIEITVIPKMESIVQGFRDTDLPDGEYTVYIKDEIYTVELINYYDNMTYSIEEGQTTRTVSLGDNSTDYKTLVVKYHGDLTIDKGVTVTATTVNNLTYKKGMYICVLGNIYNNGDISMTARGTYNVEGENVYLWKNIDDSIEYVPEEGGAGGASAILPSYTPRYSQNAQGNNGADGKNRQTGGGASGAALGGWYSGKGIKSGIGGRGTSYSGGSGSAGVMSQYQNHSYSISGSNASQTGGTGSSGIMYRDGNWSCIAYGGTGNVNGYDVWGRSKGYYEGNSYYTSRPSGTGGLLMLYADELHNNGSISSNGVNNDCPLYGSWSIGGGASGGGSINIFARLVKEPGRINVSGGTTSATYRGGNGGTGSVTINELGSVLNYAKKTIKMKTEEKYQIDKSKLWYVKLNEIQTEDLIIGNLKYETEDGTIAEVDETGKIVAVGKGETKIKITDIDNGYSTYITVKVTEEGQVEAGVKAGKDFVVALKENGTVWTWGTNEEGQLGLGTNGNQDTVGAPFGGIPETRDTTVPVCVSTLTDIKQIEAGEKIAIALDEEGNVYTWGANTGENNNVNEGNVSKIPQKIEVITNIEKINSYKDKFYAIDKEGKAYIWGKENNEPRKIETEIGIEDIKGEIFLGEDGRIYFIENPETAVQYINGIKEIDVGEDHYVFLTVEGLVYSIGKGELGQLGKPNYIEGKTPNLVRTVEGYLENVKEITAGNKTGMGITEEGKVYVWGDNTNGKLGIEEGKVYNAKEITKVQDKNGRELNLKEMEIVEGGTNNSYIGDKEGNVYSVGINDKGQLGIGDNIGRKIFTQIGQIEIKTNPEEIKVGKGETKEIGIIASSSFNLKKDTVEGQEIKVTNTNEKEIGIEKIEGINNEGITNIKESKANYKITGRKIGRVNIVATNGKYTGNIWINVVNEEKAEAPAKVENGKGFTISLKAEGTVWSWGANEKGQLGLGNTENKNEPTQIEIEDKIKDISVGETHVVALNKNGEVYTWGLNKNGQLGTGNTITYNKPTKLNLKDIEKVIAKGNTTYGINKEGKVYAWGENHGKTPSLLNIPENVIDIGNKYYLTAEGKVKKLIDNSEIKVETGTTVPVSVTNVLSENGNIGEEAENGNTEETKETIEQISEGQDHVLLLGKSGKVYGYGENTNGQLGIGDTTTDIDQTDVGNTINSNPDNVGAPFGRPVVKAESGEILQNITEISAGKGYSIAVDKEGKVYTWGINKNKQLGQNNEAENGGIVESKYAKEKEDIEKVERVEAGENHTSIYTKEGKVYTWGAGDKGQLGTGEKEDKWEAQKVGKEIVETNTSEILIEEEESYKIESYINDYNLFNDKNGEIEYETLDEEIAQIDKQTGKLVGKKEGRTEIIAKEKATEKKGIIKVRILEKGTKPEGMDKLIEPEVKTAGSRIAMLKVDGTVWSYGIGEYGELGRGKEETTDEPVQAKFPEGTKIIKIAVGENHNIALDSQGNVWTWGRNNYKQLGIETTEENILIPTRVIGLTNIKDIECGSNTSYVIGKEGQIYSWGQNGNGEGGIGSTASKTGINEVKGITNAIDIKAGKNHAIIQKSTGEIYAIGTNENGEGGIESQTSKILKATKIENIGTVVAIGVGDNHSMAITEDGKVYGWGSNINGELGLGTSTKIEKPSEIPNLENISYIDGGKGYSIALNNQGEMYTTGTNESGEQGNGSKTSTSTYQKVETIENVMQVSGGKRHTVILRKDGTVWGCGDYTQGNEEIESKTKSETPVQIGEEETGIKETEIIIEKQETKKLTVKNAYRLNLIKLEENFADSLTYESLDEEIATVDENGKVTGKEIGRTTIKATSEIDGKEYSVEVEVIEAGVASNTNLLKIEIDGDSNVEKREDGSYHYKLAIQKDTIEIKATTEDEKAEVKIEIGEYEIHETIRRETIIGNETEIKIRVRGEDGTTKEYTLIIEKTGNNTSLEKVEINGQRAKYIESKNRYEIKLDDEILNVEATAEDKLASVQFINVDKWLGNEENAGAGTPQKGTNNITITKEGKETEIKVKVTSPNGKETEIYTIAIVEKSSNNKLDTIKVNGEIVEAKEDGSYYVGIKHNETEIQIEAIAEDLNAKTAINEETQNTYIANKTERIEEGKTIYNYTIKVEAENGEIAEYNLIVEQLEGNTNIIKILVEKEQQKNVEETENTEDTEEATQPEESNKETEINLNEATLQEDGTYYYKIERVENAKITVEPESEKAGVSINGGEYQKTTITENEQEKINPEEKVDLPEERNEIAIKVKAEDGTEKEYKLIIEKKSPNVEIKEITGEGIIETEIRETEGQIRINEELETIEITITLKNDKAQLKLEGEETYEEKQITRTISIIEGEETGIEPIKLNIKAEDGTEKEYTINIIKDINLELETVKVNNEMLEYNKEQGRYEKQVENGNNPEITITSNNPKQTIQLLNEQRQILATGTGTLTTTQTLGTENLTTKYIIKVISNKGENYGANESELWITQKSIETGITYVKVDGLGTNVSADKTTYSSEVSGKEKYPIEIKLKDEKAQVEVEDLEGNTLIDKQTGILRGELEIGNGQTKQYKIKVTAENGNQKEYILEITRISNKVEIEQITVTDYNEEETEIITKEVTEYDKETKTYKIIVSRNLKETEINIKTNASNLEIDGTQTTSISKKLKGEGTAKIGIKTTAKDGTEEIRYLEIIQLSNNANLEYVKIDGKEKKADQIGGQIYTIVIPKQATEVEIEAKAEHEKAKIAIGENQEENQITKQIIDLRNITKDEIEIPVKVTAEDGETVKTYKLKIRRTGTEITGKVITENIEGKHRAIIRAYKTEEKQIEQIESKTEIEQPIKQKVTKQTEEKEIIDEVETEEDGRFEIILEIGHSYDIVISKEGYLAHTITNIEVEEEPINIGEIELIAGDVAESGEIEIDDLVDLNDNYGIVITEKNRETKGRYDLNEDGKIDILDRNILKKNYGKIAEIVKWVKPEEEKEQY